MRRRKPPAVSQVERHRQVMARLDAMAWACYLRCKRGGLSEAEARNLALDDMDIRARVASGKAVKLRTAREGRL